MTKITEKTVRHLAKLARISISETEESQLGADLGKILSYVEQLNEVNTDGVEPLYYVLEGDLQTPQREDQVVQTLATQDFLRNAPQHVAQMIKVPTVVSKTKTKEMSEQSDEG